jgi:hypothetical protein
MGWPSCLQIVVSLTPQSIDEGVTASLVAAVDQFFEPETYLSSCQPN